MCPDSSIPLPNTSPLMSPTPTTVKSCVWVSIPISRKCRLTDSRAAGRDAHRLVVVAGRTARGECVASQKPYCAATPLAMSENAAVPLSAATTR